MKKRNGTNQSLWRRTVWLLLWLLMLPSVTALAGNGMDNKSLWTVMQSGTNTIKITVPVYDEEGKDGWVSKGYLYVTPEGGSKETVLNFYSKEKSGDRCHLFIKRAVNGNMTLTRDGGLSSGTIGTNEKRAGLAALKRVQDNMAQCASILRERDCEVEYAIGPGNHMSFIPERFAAGLAALDAFLGA